MIKPFLNDKFIASIIFLSGKILYLCKIVFIMSNFVRQQEERKEIKEKEKLSRENLGKFFFDLAKLVFTSMALVGGVSLIVNEARIQQGILATIGVSLTYTFAAIGYKILKR